MKFVMKLPQQNMLRVAKSWDLLDSSPSRTTGISFEPLAAVSLCALRLRRTRERSDRIDQPTTRLAAVLLLPLYDTWRSKKPDQCLCEAPDGMSSQTQKGLHESPNTYSNPVTTTAPGTIYTTAEARQQHTCMMCVAHEIK